MGFEEEATSEKEEREKIEQGALFSKTLVEGSSDARMAGEDHDSIRL
jgi:hypothetical protein